MNLSTGHSMILGLASLIKMGADIRLDNCEIKFVNLSYFSTPLLNRRLKPLSNHQEPEGPSIDHDRDEYEEWISSLDDDELRDHVQAKLSNWVPLRAETRLRPGVPPQHHRAYPIAPTEINNMTLMIDDLVNEGVLREVVPDAQCFISPCFLRPKGNGGRRLLVDMRHLNKCQVPADLDLPNNPKEELKKLAPGTCWFGVIDVSNAFHSVEYADGLSKKLHCITVFGKTFEYMRCVQGDENSPKYWYAHLHGFFVAALGHRYREWCIPYVDDILIYADSEAKCITRQRVIKQVLICAGKNIG